MSTKTDKSAPVQTPLCAQRAQLLADAEQIAQALARVDAQLIALGAGRYTDETGAHTFTVVAATPGSPGAPRYELPSEAEAQARELAGDEFAKLFDRKVTYTPCEGFVAVVPKLLTPAKARTLIALCTVPGRATSGKAAFVRKG